MLVLSRRKHEAIVIGDSIKITVADVKGDTVRLAIDAPNHIKIFREEIYRAIVSENQAASLQGRIDDLGLLPNINKK